jgi:SAM-dependent methyltransferase
MITEPKCPLCAANNLEHIGAQTYARSDEGLSGYTATRYEILFDLWSDDGESFTANYQLCVDCGFVLYSPRPTADEVAAKYTRLGGASSSTVENPVVMPIDRVRSDEIFGHVSSLFPMGARVLDFGGGTGSLMCQFVARGFNASVVDYAPHAIEGVTRLGRTVAELESAQRFDLIVASHVIEHVPEPLGTVRGLAEHLEDGGALYIEVPFELLGGPPNRRDPVTHINFFSDESLRQLVAQAGLDVERVWTQPTTHAQGHQSLSSCVIACRNGDLSARSVTANVDSVRDLLGMGAAAQAGFLLRYPKMLLNPIKRFTAKRRG